jgi:hypothetical protein
MHRIVTLLCLLSAPSQAVALNEAPWPIPKLVKFADLIVVGVAADERGKKVIEASTVLKGERTKQVVLRRVEAGIYREVVIKSGNKGIFLLKKDGSEYAPFNHRSYLSPEHTESVQAAIKMIADPGPFLDRRRFPENTDIIYVLDEQFTGWNVTSKEIPSLTWMGPPFHEVAPWQEKGIVRLQCQADRRNGFMVSVTSAEPEGELSACLKHRLFIGFKEASARQGLPPNFSVTVDARLPERAGSATADQAMRYLRERLMSADSEIVLAALLALAKMRDLDAVPHVLPLLEHKDQRIRVRALQFLGWSRDERAVVPLGKLLEATTAQYPKDHLISDHAAEALGKIGREASLPILERAAGYGVQRAIEAVGAVADTESFDTLLTALEKNPSRCSHITFALYWLVRRSNKKTEEWMTDSSTTQAKEITKVPLWRTWWDKHRKDFTILKSQEQVINESIQAH